MSRRYTYSRTINTVEGQETFTAVEFDSFDESIAAVEKGIAHHKIALAEKHPPVPAAIVNVSITPPPVVEDDKLSPPRGD